eukprot:CAMPEP_0196591218 /NCGR_PEP_ID=MMETSP1081-20130531/68865_1 /TAXON_ID=36882 /ORGANISM="Pyramimonas amylifera, Strain CCMP720" /LENGTH=196 /DNA_ID=CAMNT_0041914517 /DNA_START=173 /DNA_END=763 /DNA_ORIENTATION=+
MTTSSRPGQVNSIRGRWTCRATSGEKKDEYTENENGDAPEDLGISRDDSTFEQHNEILGVPYLQSSTGELEEQEAWWVQLPYVFVITFFEEGKDSAGYYANRVEDAEGILVDIIVAFEDLDDAIRHCGLLQANIIDEGRVPKGRVDSIDIDTLTSICDMKSCRCSVQRKGSLLMPPEQLVVEDDVDTMRKKLEELL